MGQYINKYRILSNSKQISFINLIELYSVVIVNDVWFNGVINVPSESNTMNILY